MKSILSLSNSFLAISLPGENQTMDCKQLVDQKYLRWSGSVLGMAWRWKPQGGGAKVPAEMEAQPWSQGDGSLFRGRLPSHSHMLSPQRHHHPKPACFLLQ